MRGKRSLQWIWDWLGDGSMGENYEVLPSVQPITLIDAQTYPRRLQSYTAIDNIIAGTVFRALPRPLNADGSVDTSKTRIWFDLWYNRSVVAATDVTTLWRTNEVATDYPLAEFSGVLLAGTRFVPVINAWATGPVLAGATVIQIAGRPPVAVQSNESLRFGALGVAAVGTISYWGHYFDVNSSSPLPTAFLQ